MLEKSDKNNLIDQKVIGSEEVNWNKWIRVPEVEDGILRAKIHCRSNFLRTIMTFVYKDAAFYIEYKLENDEILKYRFVPANAGDGIWINPFIRNVSDQYFESFVTEIRFSNNGYSIMKDEIRLEWELTEMNTDVFLPDSNLRDERFVYANKMFRKYFVPKQTVRSFNDFEDVYPGWSANRDKLSKLLSYSGDHSIKLDTSDRFTPTYSISVGELKFPPSSTINVKASVFTYLTNGAEGNLVITVQQGDNVKYWNGVSLNELSVPNTWNKVTIDKNLPRDLQASDVIKIYVWNNGYNDLYVAGKEMPLKH